MDDASVDALCTFDPAAIAASCGPFYHAEDMRHMWRHLTWLAFDKGFETVRAPLTSESAHAQTVRAAFSALAECWQGHTEALISPWIAIETFIEIKGFFDQQEAESAQQLFFEVDHQSNRVDFLEWADRETALCIDAIPSHLFLFPRTLCDSGSTILMTAIQAEAGPLTIEGLLERGARFSAAEEARLDDAFGGLEESDLL